MFKCIVISSIVSFMAALVAPTALADEAKPEAKPKDPRPTSALRRAVGQSPQGAVATDIPGTMPIGPTPTGSLGTPPAKGQAPIGTAPQKDQKSLGDRPKDTSPQ